MPASELDEHVLGVLARAPAPMGAYEIIVALRDARKSIAAPPVYRALKRLIYRRAIERIETLSAYRIREGEKCLYAICDSCGCILTVPVPHAFDGIEAAMSHTGFSAERLLIEATGRCACCGEAVNRVCRP